MEAIWISPTDFVTGDPTLVISYPSVSHPSTIVTCTAPGDFKWISMGLRLPSNIRIETLTICYQISNPNPQTPPTSFISQVRLVEMNTPDLAHVIHDDPAELKSTSPESYSSKVNGFVPTTAVSLALRLNFQNTTDQVMLGAVSVKSQAITDMRVNKADFGEACDAAIETESETRAPIHWEWNPWNWFLDKFNPALFAIPGVDP
jgi:hypothetical protein